MRRVKISVKMESGGTLWEGQNSSENSPNVDFDMVCLPTAAIGFPPTGLGDGVTGLLSSGYAFEETLRGTSSFSNRSSMS